MNKTADTNLWGIHAGKPVAEDIEETTRDSGLKRLAQELKGHPLADFVAYLLNTMGNRTRIQFDSRYKGLPPLRRVYVPEAIESDEESQDALTGRASQFAALDGNSTAIHCRRCASSLGVA